MSRRLPPRNDLGREIVLMLGVKALLLLLLWGLFFSPAHRPVTDEATLQRVLLQTE